MNTKYLTRILWPVAVAVTLMLTAGNIWFGELNQDEGWYLYAGRMVAEGHLPFIDFASTQGPVMAFVYAAAWPIVKAFGVLGGRVFTAILGLLCAFGAAWLSYRLAVHELKCRRETASISALLTFIFIGINVYQSYFFSIVKTYALAGLLLVLAFLALSFVNSRYKYFMAFLSGMFMSLAVATRLSAIAVIPTVMIVYIIQVMRGRGTAEYLKIALWLSVGALITGLICFLPFLVKAPEATWFGLVEYHAGRDAGGIVKLLAYKVGFLARCLNVYFVAIAALVAGYLTALFSGRKIKIGSTAITALGFAILAVSILHFSAAFPYDDYQVMLFPLLAVFLVLFLIRLIAGWNSSGNNKILPLYILLVVLFILNLGFAFASPRIQNWFIGKRDKIWWPLKEKSSLALLRETADELRKKMHTGDLLLTQDTYLAVEVGAHVPHGLELGPFSYFPDWSDTKAEACHVLNRTSMIALLERAEAPVAALSGYSFVIGCPEVKELPVQEQLVLWDILERHYKLAYTVDGFGQAETELEIFLRK